MSFFQKGGMSNLKRIWLILLASAVGLVMLLWLGTWQVQRLQWKEALLADLEMAMAAEPVALAETKGRAHAKIKVKGRFSAKSPLRMLSTHESGPAWELVQGFVGEGGEQALVLRGKQPHGAPDVGTIPETVEIIGHVRSAPRKGTFDVANNVTDNQWTWWDVPEMARQFGLKDPAIVALLPGSPGTQGLQVDPPKANLRNNHLGYAITWFGLAIVLIVMTAFFVRERMKEG